MSLSDGRTDGASASARSMEAPADDDRPARPAVPAAPSASPPFSSVRRLTRFVPGLGLVRRASSRGVMSLLLVPSSSRRRFLCPELPVRVSGKRRWRPQPADFQLLFTRSLPAVQTPTLLQPRVHRGRTGRGGAG